MPKKFRPTLKGAEHGLRHLWERVPLGTCAHTRRALHAGFTAAPFKMVIFRTLVSLLTVWHRSDRIAHDRVSHVRVADMHGHMQLAPGERT